MVYYHTHGAPSTSFWYSSILKKEANVFKIETYKITNLQEAQREQSKENSQN